MLRRLGIAALIISALLACGIPADFAATVELDGCFRVHRPNNTLGQSIVAVLET